MAIYLDMIVCIAIFHFNQLSPEYEPNMYFFRSHFEENVDTHMLRSSYMLCLNLYLSSCVEVNVSNFAGGMLL